MTLEARQAQAPGVHGLSGFTFPSQDTLECPYPFYSAMRREAPVYRLPNQDVYFISRWEDIAYTVQHPELFSPAPDGRSSLGADRASECPAGTYRGEFSREGLSNCDGAEHRLKRSMALKLVAPERLRRYRSFIDNDGKRADRRFHRAGRDGVCVRVLDAAASASDLRSARRPSR